MKYTGVLSPVVGSEQGECARYLLYKNNMGNKYSPTGSLLPLCPAWRRTSCLPHIRLSDTEAGTESIILMDVIRTIDKSRLVKYMGSVGERQWSSGRGH